MAESYISELGDKYGGSGVSNSAGQHVKIIAPKVYETSTSSIVNLTSAFAAKVNTASVGVANGVASLDANGKVPTGQLPSLQSLTAGTDLKISNSIISVNTNGTIGNSAQMSFVAGSGTYASGIGAAAFGFKTSAVGNDAFAEGAGTSAVGYESHAEGYSTSAYGDNSHAEGAGTLASGNEAHAEGYSTLASGNGSHAEGGITSAVGYVSHAEGFSAIASGDYSHAEGSGTKAYGDYSHAEGYNASALGSGSHAEGIYSFIATESKAGHCGGMNNAIAGEALLTAANINATDLGSITSLSSWNSKPPKLPGQLQSYDDRIFPGLGYAITNYYNDFNTSQGALGSQAVFGLDNTAIGRASTVIGYSNAAISPYTFVAGKGNIALDYGQSVVGPWAETRHIQSARFIVGVGSGNDARKNGLVVTDSSVDVPLPIFESSQVVVGEYPMYYTTVQAGIVNTYFRASANQPLQNTALSINGDLNVNGDISFQTLHTNKIASNSNNGLEIWGTSSVAGNPCIFIPSASNGIMEINNGVVINNDLGVNGIIIATSSISGHIINYKDSDYWIGSVVDSISAHILSGITNFYLCYTGAFTANIPWSALKPCTKYHFARVNTTGYYATLNIIGLPANTTAISREGSAVAASTTYSIQLAYSTNRLDGQHVDIIPDKLYATAGGAQFIWDRY